MTESTGTDQIGDYEYLNYDDQSQIFQPWDPRTLEVARQVAALIEERMPDARVEHVGSTAISGCDGKGIVDLLLMYSPGRLAAARDALDGLGFQRQGGADPFPEERPLRLGTYHHDGDTFRLHVHVIAGDSPEAREQLYLRDHLREHPELVEEYVAAKRASLAELAAKPGEVARNIAYNKGKEPVIQRILAGMEQATGS